VSWHRVVFACELDDDGNCPECDGDYTECPCPGPTEDEVTYRVKDGILEGERDGDHTAPVLQVTDKGTG
jgi:hypothetical protein